MRRYALGREADTVGSLQLDLEGRCSTLACAIPNFSLNSMHTCGDVVKVLVDKLNHR